MNLREQLVSIALAWEKEFTVAPAITSAISEYDAARLLGCSEDEFKEAMKGQTAVTKGTDFIWKNQRFQIKANRPSGRRGSTVTRVGKATNYDWDFLVWILYNKKFELVEAWKWPVNIYQEKHGARNRLAPNDMRDGGERLK